MNLALDCETELIGPGRGAPRIACVAVQGDNDPAPRLCTIEEAGRELRAFAQGEGWLIGHNFAFDAVCLCEADPTLAPVLWGLYQAGRVWDLGLHERIYALAKGWREAHPVLKRPIISQGIRLSDLALIHLDLDLSADKASGSPRYRYGELIGVPFERWPEESRVYALQDATVTLKIFEAQQAALKDPEVKVERGALVDFRAQVIADFALRHLGCWGLRTCPERVRIWREELTRKRESLLTLPRERELVRDNGSRDMKAIREALDEAHGGKAPRTEKGSISTSSEALSGSGDPALVALAEEATLGKLLGTYGPVLDQGTIYPLAPRWNVLVATGRTSAKSPALQTIPQQGGVREAFTPRPGWVYAGADYATAELCALAQVCLLRFGRSEMASAIKAGRDLHLALAARIAGVSYEEAAERRAAKDPEILKLRKMAKPVNFGFPGGLSAPALADMARTGYGIPMTPEEASDLKDLWFAQWPEMREYFSACAQDTDRGLIVHPYSGRIKRGGAYTETCNAYFQGLIADGAKRALVEVVRRCYMEPESPLYGCRAVLFVHDEIILEAPEDRAPEAAEELARVMVEEMRPYLPDVGISADPWCSRVWSKSVETVREEGGRLAIQN